MCGSEKCCFVVPLKSAIVAIGIISLICSTVLASTAILCLELHLTQHSHHHQVNNFIGLSLSDKALNTVSVMMIIVAVIWLVATVLLFIGVVRKIPSFVLFCFMTGVLIVILGLLGGILVLLGNSWPLAIAMITMSLVYLHFVVVIYSVYEQMQKGESIFHHRRRSDQDLLTDFDFNSID